MKTYVVPEVMKLLCDVQDIALSPPFSESWERVSQCDDTNKNELLQHSKTDVDLFFLHLVDFSVTCIAKFFAPGKMLFCIGKLRLSVIHRNETEGDIGTI